jgi:hypothetical protein
LNADAIAMTKDSKYFKAKLFHELPVRFENEVWQRVEKFVVAHVNDM